jgi:hypothetical protein
MKKIEDFLGLTEKEIIRRKRNLREQLPQRQQGLKYLEEKAKVFNTQPWPFLIYFASWAPDKLKEELSCYRDYDGAENFEIVFEQLKEYYIISRLIIDLKKEQKEVRGE